MERMGNGKLAKKADAQKMEKAGEEDCYCNGRTALRETWTEWKKNAEQHQQIKGIEYS